MIGEAEARSALGWWLQAGVDVAVQEEPRNWLLPPQPRKPTAPAEPVPPTPTDIPDQQASDDQYDDCRIEIELQPLLGLCA